MTTLHTAKFQILAAGGAMAHDITVDTLRHVSTQTGAEVAQEPAQCKKGRHPWSTSYNVGAATLTTHTRAEVVGRPLKPQGARQGLGLRRLRPAARAAGSCPPASWAARCGTPRTAAACSR